MTSNSDDIQAASSDTRPPMLDMTDYESWSQRIRLYYRGKENGLQILQSIDQGPFELGTTRNTFGTTPEGGVLLGPERPRNYDDLSDTKKKRYNADVRATNIVLQGLPKDIYKLINHNIEAKAISDNSGLNKTVRFVRTDNGTKFINKDLTDYYESVSITHEKTVLRTPQQNSVVEQWNGTLVEAARTMMIFSKAPLFL
ncbi:integrase, catalytic region, zinc finger, CCHC-type containing protein [Tanacetum coccineum]